ncbi:hypothetical protein [Anoxynatronum buryatiense]|uniref:Uncharacterized protein n=1 Tax=Anoxynatronum buryatiense TaxID=489973 RepID=A0AA46AKK5_9CLOT|nr:hypothetical protein [Anoxynatronum buryatiense]SMP71667.1 hypothetical protein SAMN06296020_12413 [Anoxynatronum buryatiense]
MEPPGRRFPWSWGGIWLGHGTERKTLAGCSSKLADWTAAADGKESNHYVMMTIRDDDDSISVWSMQATVFFIENVGAVSYFISQYGQNVYILTIESCIYKGEPGFIYESVSLQGSTSAFWQVAGAESHSKHINHRNKGGEGS